MKKAILALSVAALMATSTAFATNGYFGHGYSTKEKGMAGAGVAYSQDSIATATNPAGIANMDNRFDIGLAVFSPNREYEVSGNPTQSNMTFGLMPGTYESDNNAFLIPNAGAVWSLGNGSAIGLAMYGNGGMDTEYNGVPSPAPGYVPDGTFYDGPAAINLMQAFFNLTYATQVNSNNSIGISAIGAVQSFKARGLGNFGVPDAGTDFSTGAGVKIGWQGKVASALTLGASYQSKIWMSEFDDYSTLFVDDGDFDIPATATVGLAWNTSPSTVLVLDVQQIYYSDVRALNNGMMDPTGGGFGWDDMTIVKAGYEFGTDDGTVWRVGASYGDQPIREGQNMFNILAPAVITTHFTGGFTTPVGTDQEITVAGMYAPSNTVSGANPMDPAQTIDLTMDQYELQVGYALKF